MKWLVVLLMLAGCSPSQEDIDRAAEIYVKTQEKCKEFSKQFEKVQKVYIQKTELQGQLCIIELNKVNEQFYRLPVELSFDVENLSELNRFIAIQKKHGIKK